MSIFTFVVPLFLLSVKTMFSPVGFDFNNCKQADSTDNAALTVDSFTESCEVGAVPLVFVSDPTNCNPLIFKNGVCIGIATAVKGKINNTVALIQYGVFGALILYGFILWNRELYEKRNVCIAIKMKGSYFSKDVITFSYAGGLWKWFKNDFSKKFTPYVDYPIIAILTILYIYSLTVQQITRSPYYIFDSPATDSEQLFSSYHDYTVETQPEDGDCSSNKVKNDLPRIAECSALTNFAYYIDYKNTLAGNPYLAVLQGAFFLYKVLVLISSQKSAYEWVDGDEIMDSHKKKECPYYHIVL